MPETANKITNKRDPVALVKSVVKVASLPTIFTKLNEAINDPRKTTRDFARIINEDSALAARLLRIANSALFNFPSKIETVNHAVTIIGTNQLRDLVLAASVMKLFQNVPEELVSMESFWRHNIACGVAARVIANMRRETNVERYFVTGLLHDIGRLILYMEMPKEMGTCVEQARIGKQFLFGAENELLGFDHAKIGGLLLKNWQLPDRLEEAVAYHHAPQKAKKFPVDAAVIHVADIIANALALGSSGELYVPSVNEAAWLSLNLEPDQVAVIIDQLQVQYDDAIGFIMQA